jgi:hypothetical protein
MHGWWLSEALAQPIISHVGVIGEAPGFFTWTPVGLDEPWIIENRLPPVDLSSQSEGALAELLENSKSVPGARIPCRIEPQRSNQFCFFFAVWDETLVSLNQVELIGVYFGEEKVGLVERNLFESSFPDWRNVASNWNGPGS